MCSAFFRIDESAGGGTETLSPDTAATQGLRAHRFSCTHDTQHGVCPHGLCSSEQHWCTGTDDDQSTIVQEAGEGQHSRLPCVHWKSVWKPRRCDGGLVLPAACLLACCLLPPLILAILTCRRVCYVGRRRSCLPRSAVLSHLLQRCLRLVALTCLPAWVAPPHARPNLAVDTRRP